MIAIFDTETTGLPKAMGTPIDEQPFVTELYVGKFDNNLKYIDSYHSTFSIPIPVPPFITKLNGITDETLKDSPEFVEQVDVIAEFMRPCNTWVAHNFQFDHTMILLELQRLGLQHLFPWPTVTHCTVELSMSIHSHKLSLKKLYKIATGNEYIQTHRASDDVEALYECYAYLRKKELVT